MSEHTNSTRWMPKESLAIMAEQIRKIADQVEGGHLEPTMRVDHGRVILELETRIPNPIKSITRLP